MEVLKLAKQALLLMDMQIGIVSRLPSERSEALLSVLSTTAAAARKTRIPVIHVRVAFRAGTPEISQRNQAFSNLAASGAMAETDDATQIHPAISPQPGDIVVIKRRVSAFTGSDLEVILRSQGIDSLVLTGIATSGVVLSTLRQAADLDYALTVLEDGCADMDPEVHRVLTEKVYPRQARVTSASDWIHSLGG
jgi:nicotinamidase-related amidase